MLLLAGAVTVSAGNLFPDPGIRQKRKWSLPEGFRITADASRPGDNMMAAERSEFCKIHSRKELSEAETRCV